MGNRADNTVVALYGDRWQTLRCGDWFTMHASVETQKILYVGRTSIKNKIEDSAFPFLLWIFNTRA